MCIYTHIRIYIYIYVYCYEQQYMNTRHDMYSAIPHQHTTEHVRAEVHVYMYTHVHARAGINQSSCTFKPSNRHAYIAIVRMPANLISMSSIRAKHTTNVYHMSPTILSSSMWRLPLCVRTQHNCGGTNNHDRTKEANRGIRVRCTGGIPTYMWNSQSCASMLRDPSD